jgi:tetratricopeptide (TPR) repeat protein
MRVFSVAAPWLFPGPWAAVPRKQLAGAPHSRELSRGSGTLPYGMRRWWKRAGAAAIGGLAWGCAPAMAPAGPIGPPVHIEAETRIVTADDVATQADLESRGERALLEQRWKDASDAYRLLLAADPNGPRASGYMFDLGLSLEGLERRADARDTFLELGRRFPDGPKARAALVRAATLDAYLEDWSALEAIGEELLARPDVEDIERVVALGARGLARVERLERGPPAPVTVDASAAILQETAPLAPQTPSSDERRSGDASLDVRASADILEGLDLSDRFHYGDRDVLPVAVAQLRFALGELRRVRSERIAFEPLPPDFIAKLDERCAGLLEAQAAYSQAVRSVDPHWAAMSGYRVGEMYRHLHRDLMRIPPPPTSKTERQKQIFFAFMHIRYRVLLEKGLREIEQTVALGERTQDSSSWISRAREARAEMQTALADEKAQIERMPFTEAEVAKALELMEKKNRAGAAPRP